MAEDRKERRVVNLIPGFAQGLVRSTISHPFDVVKVNVQTAVGRTTPIAEFKRIVRHRPSMLFRGYPFSASGVALERAFGFAIFESVLKNNAGVSPFFAGLCAAIPCSMVAVPIQSITSNLVTGNRTEGSSLRYVEDTVRKEGVRFFFRAYPWDVMRSTVAGTIYMGVYGKCRQLVGSDTTAKVAAASIAAGCSVWAVQYPYDTAKTLYQTSRGADVAAGRSGTGVASTALAHFRGHGIAGFYRGISAVLFRTIPSSVAGMVVYERVMRMVDQYR